MDSVYTSCLICGGTKLAPLPRFTAAAHLVRCASCGLVFAGRRPSDRELAAHYAGYGTAWRDSEITRGRYRSLLESFEPYRKSNRILDMGCGAGYFLEEAAKHGWEAYGSEFGALPLELSRERGLTVVPAPLSADTFPPGYFDVVTSFEVVEHLRDPQGEGAILAKLLRSGGLFYCTTPNFDAISRHLLGARWEVVGYPEHLVYFTTTTLGRWLASFGLRPIAVATTGLSPEALLRHFAARYRHHGRAWAAREQTGTGDDQNQTGSNDEGRANTASRRLSLDEHVRLAAENSKILLRAKEGLNRGLSALHAGDTIKARFVYDGSRQAG